MSSLFIFWHGMITHLWQTTLILALIFVIDRAVRGAPSRVSHALWSIGLLKIFLPLSLFGGVSRALYRAAAGSSPGGGQEAIPGLHAVAAVLYPIDAVSAPGRGSTMSYVLVGATAAWAALALLFLARIVLDVTRARRGLGRPLTPIDTEGSRRLASILDRLGIPREKVILCGGFEMPAVTGLFRPRIVIPEKLADELSDEELRAILLHEDTHRRRRDPLRAVVSRLGMALFFFYPPIYPVLRRLRSTAEFACDERVVHEGVAARIYSRALARTIGLGLTSPAFATAAAVAGSSLLRRRLKRLPTLDPRRYQVRFTYRILVAAAALLVAASTLYPLPMRADAPKKPKSSGTKEQKPNSLAAVYEFDKPPVLTNHGAPAYPEEAKELGIETTVLLSLLIDENGKVTDATAIPADALAAAKSTIDTELTGEAVAKMDKAKIDETRASFERSACEAAMKWDFAPASFEGKPVKARVAVPVRFKLD
jgi:beta-lactamase regulating signal transducer with metallopeptidase domain